MYVFSTHSSIVHVVIQTNIPLYALSIHPSIHPSVHTYVQNLRHSFCSSCRCCCSCRTVMSPGLLIDFLSVQPYVSRSSLKKVGIRHYRRIYQLRQQLSHSTTSWYKTHNTSQYLFIHRFRPRATYVVELHIN